MHMSMTKWIFKSIYKRWSVGIAKIESPIVLLLVFKRKKSVTRCKLDDKMFYDAQPISIGILETLI